MAEPSEIADRALALASTFLLTATKQIVAMADGDMNALYAASQIVRNQASGPTSPSQHSTEHLAFSLITAAHAALRSGDTTGD